MGGIVLISIKPEFADKIFTGKNFMNIARWFCLPRSIEGCGLSFIASSKSH
jgi:predicted transcriptional regulator